MIIRVEHRRRFTITANETIEDPRLSFKALGLLIYLLSKPDGWRVNSAHLATTHRESLFAVRSGLNELRDCGYLRRHKEQDPDTGQWGWVQIVSERPVDAEATARGALSRPRVTHGRITAPPSKKTEEQRLKSKTPTGTSVEVVDPTLICAQNMVDDWGQSSDIAERDGLIRGVTAVMQDSDGWTADEIRAALQASTARNLRGLRTCLRTARTSRPRAKFNADMAQYMTSMDAIDGSTNS